MSRSKALVAVGLFALAGSGLTLAVAQAPGPRPTKLHEDIQVPESQTAKTSERLGRGVPIIGPTPEARQNPTAIASQDKLLPKPADDTQPEAGEPVLGRGGFGADRQTEAKADYFTGADNELHYVEVFNPSIVPFKRMSALNAIREDYTLVTNSAARTDVPVGGEARTGYDLFWGSVMVELKPGFDVPIPSVAPEMRILSYETTPATNLIFSKDSADNYYLRTDEAGAKGTFRVIFLAEASPAYFAPTVPRDLRVRDIPKDKFAPIPPDVQRVANGVLDEMRLHDKMQVAEVLDKLVYYFRSFDAKSPPPQHRQHLPRSLQQPGRGLPSSFLRVHDHRERAGDSHSILEQRGPCVGRSLAAGFELDANRPRRCRLYSQRQQCIGQVHVPATGGRPIRKAEFL